MDTPVQAFQRKYGLKPDGDVGRNTIRALMSALRLTPVRTAHFIGQCATESGDFEKAYENLNYSAKRLIEVFKSRLDRNKDGWLDANEKAKVLEIAGNPQRIANFIYANRMGNGNEASGDGWKYRGRGPLQITGKDNYRLFSKFIGEDCVANPDLVATKYYFEAALWFFNQNKLWAICDAGINVAAITKLSKAINLGNANSKAIPNGLDHRIERTNHYWRLLN